MTNSFAAKQVDVRALFLKNNPGGAANSNRANTQTSVSFSLLSPVSMRDDYSSVNVNTGGDDMTTPTREEMDAKLAAVEARTETRFVELSGKMERIIDAVNRSNDDHLRTASEAKDELRVVNQNITKEGKATRNVIIGAIIAALAALLATQVTLIAAFQTGITLHDNHSSPPKP
jgi:hypothetical protein